MATTSGAGVVAAASAIKPGFKYAAETMSKIKSKEQEQE